MIDFDGGDRIRKIPLGATNLVIIALAVAFLGVACIKFAAIGAVVFGAFGLLMGGYCMGLVRKHVTDNKNILLACAGIALLASVFAFMFGFVEFVEGL